MQISNEFTVPLPPNQAWPILLDLQRVAPCLPGATITSIDGDDFEGRAKIKVGPITAEYKGKARFIERDENAYRATLRASGKDARGQGNVSADIALRLVEEGAGSRVLVDTEMDISGKVAQFGRGVINDAAAAILGIFAERLGALMGDKDTPLDNEQFQLQSEGSAPSRNTAANQGSKSPVVNSDDEALDLVKLARSSRSSKADGAGGTVGVASPTWIPAVIAALAALISIFTAGYSAGSNRR